MTTANSKAVLFCTVGGKPEPIQNAINHYLQVGGLKKVVFVCSEKSHETGDEGSTIQVSEILESVGSAGGFETENILVPTDDLCRIHERISKKLSNEIAAVGREAVCVNYSGGTKSMSAGAVLAAIDFDVPTELSMGQRQDHIQIRSGNNYQLSVSIQDIRVRGTLRVIRSLWENFAYSEAAKQFDMLPKSGLSEELRGSVDRQHRLSLAFAMWDQFRHEEALAVLETYTKILGKWLSPYLVPLRTLTDKEGGDRRELIQIHDLWLNAERLAARNRFDDAVSRTYRVLEWIAQVILRRRHKIDTSDIDVEKIPHQMRVEFQPSSKGQVTAGLMRSWDLLRELEGTGPIVKFMEGRRQKLENLLGIRNYSILAHGFEPVSEEKWLEFHGLISEHVLPLLLQEMKLENIKMLPEQLPKELPE